ncbi:MAG: hypothetical protein KJ000_01230 [Pirellulaceae bacterium]|nr:hypothetical protein [Pirellulaceae bacterium]
MPDISFQFAPDVATQVQGEVVAKLRKLAGVQTVQRLDPESDDPLVSRMWFAQIADRRNFEVARNLLTGLSDIESVDEPPRRELVW